MSQQSLTRTAEDCSLDYPFFERMASVSSRIVAPAVKAIKNGLPATC